MGRLPRDRMRGRIERENDHRVEDGSHARGHTRHNADADGLWLVLGHVHTGTIAVWDGVPPRTGSRHVLPLNARGRGVVMRKRGES